MCKKLPKEMTTMKAMLQRLIKESKEKEVPINHREQKITKLTIKLEKWTAQIFTEGSERKEKETVFVHSKLLMWRCNQRKKR